MITYSNAAVAYTNGYQPYGQYTGTLTGNLGKWAIDKFDGKPYSSATGLYYDFQRWYDPSIGRFISQDPFAGHLSYPQTLNPYIYVGDSPTSATDPTGTDGGFGADNRCEKLHQCSSAGPDPLFTGVSNWWNSLTPTEQGAVILVGVLAVAVVSCAIGCEGFAAVPEAAAGAGLDLGLGGLSIGTLGLGTLGIGVLGLDLGIMELGTLLHPSTSDPTGQTRGGGSGGGQNDGNGGTGLTITGPPTGLAGGFGGLGGSNDWANGFANPSKFEPRPYTNVPRGRGLRGLVCAGLATLVFSASVIISQPQSAIQGRENDAYGEAGLAGSAALGTFFTCIRYLPR